MPGNLENSAEATGLEKVSFHSNPKESSNYRTTALISHASKVMLKISKFSKPGLHSTWAENFQIYKLDFKKAEELGIKLPTSAGS